MTIVKVALAIPLYNIFDYRLPKQYSGQLEPGMRVLVPFGNNKRVGLIIRLENTTNQSMDALKPLEEVLDKKTLISPSHLDYLNWVARYYQQPVGETMFAAIPPRLRQAKPQLSLTSKNYSLSETGKSTSADLLNRATKQQALFTLLNSQTAPLDIQQIKTLGYAWPVVKGLLDKGLIIETDSRLSRPQFLHRVNGPELTDEQADAIDSISRSFDTFTPFLLDGITGSGKTEVYLQLAARILSQGKNVLILVPEIALTPQLIRRFQERFGNNVASFHSSLSANEKETLWHNMARGIIPLVVGTRSAILVPFEGLGLIVVDEEHDTSYKQQDGLHYHARDLALVRGTRAQCPVVLGSATPSLESLFNKNKKRYNYLKLTSRPGQAKTPSMRLVDIRDQKLDNGLSTVTKQAIAATLDNNQQVIVFINRRGFAPVLTCYDCGWLSECPRCDAKQTVHARLHTLWCHHCGSQRKIPIQCPECHSTELHPLGFGTERIEHALEKLYPETPIIRIDRDATRKKGSLDEVLTKIHEAEDGAILVGTQMLAKGHHFPNVTLVCVLNADAGLFSADFRASENMSQLLTQVAGRAGRSKFPGEVLIQSRFPDHPLLQTLVNSGYNAFAEQALEERRAAELPPWTYQVLLRAEANQEKMAMQFLLDVQKLIRKTANSPGIEIWGPVTATMSRKAGKFRTHLLVQSASRGELQALFTIATRQIATLKSARKVRWAIDVDCLDFS